MWADTVRAVTGSAVVPVAAGGFRATALAASGMTDASVARYSELTGTKRMTLGGWLEQVRQTFGPIATTTTDTVPRGSQTPVGIIASGCVGCGASGPTAGSLEASDARMDATAGSAAPIPNVPRGNLSSVAPSPVPSTAYPVMFDKQQYEPAALYSGDMVASIPRPPETLVLTGRTIVPFSPSTVEASGGNVQSRRSANRRDVATFAIVLFLIAVIVR